MALPSVPKKREAKMREVLKSGKAVELMVMYGICVSRIDTDKEDDTCFVWWSEHCSCFHWAYNGEFRGMYTGSFINMVPCGIGRPDGYITNNGTGGKP
jgi:hypothetical protein